jgi:hypothetical protein
MTPAISTLVSPIGPASPISFGGLWTLLAFGCRNSPQGVPPAGSYGDNQPLRISWDVEWDRKDEENQLLTYQFYAQLPGGGEWFAVLKPAVCSRVTLNQFLATVVQLGMQAGILSDWPTEIVLLAHFTRADLSMFWDFPKLRLRFDSVRNTFATMRKPCKLTLWDQQRHGHPVTVVLRDTMLLTPGGELSLAALGKQLGLEKLELSPAETKNMGGFLASDPNRYCDYALRDPEICLRLTERLLKQSTPVTGSAKLPPTLSSLGVTQLLRLWEQAGISRHSVLGTELLKDKKWNAEKGRNYTRTKTIPTRDRHRYESVATECYHGGRNEQFLFGAGLRGLWTDYDLCGAYTTALALIGMPDWSAMRQTRDLDEFQPTTLGFAQVRFSFPDGTRFPCLPVCTPFGLIFPLTGISDCCSPEIYLAVKMGARLEIVTGLVVPCDPLNPPFLPFIQHCTRERISHPKGSFEEALWKDVGNGLYGKLAQGLMMKRCYDSRSDAYAVLPPSRITNPFFAAYTTSLVRAVMGEFLHRLPPVATVCNVTTDGFLTTASPEAVAHSAAGPLGLLFARARQDICGDPKSIEAKHRIAQPLGWRTRGQATLESLPGQPFVLAKAGLKPPTRDKALQNEWIIGQFLSRTPGSRYEFDVLRSMADMCRQGGDLVPESIDRRLNMDFDWKRRPVDPCHRNIRGQPHLAFDTVPWESEAQFIRCRERWDEFRRDRVLKTTADLTDFEDFLAANPVAGIRRPRRNGEVRLALRMFLRAFVRDRCGLTSDALSYPELAAWLTELGYPCKREAVENARRRNAVMQPRAVRRTPAVVQFVAAVQCRFPSFDAEQLLEPVS